MRIFDEWCLLALQPVFRELKRQQEVECAKEKVIIIIKDKR